MSKENVEVVRRVFEAFEAELRRGEDFEDYDLGDVFTPDTEWFPVPETPGPTSYRGREGFIEFMRTWIESWQSWTVRLERLIDADNGRIVAVMHQSATGKGSGVPVEQNAGIVFELENGRVVRMRNFLHLAQALEAAGLSE
jgi:ketosteroid isomerase-like protein